MGRKAQLALAAFGAPFLVATAALFLDKATFAEWAGFVSVQAPLVLGLYGASNVAQKIGLSNKAGE